MTVMWLLLREHAQLSWKLLNTSGEKYVFCYHCIDLLTEFEDKLDQFNFASEMMVKYQK